MNNKEISEGCKEMSKLIIDDKDFISSGIDIEKLDYSLESLKYIEKIITKIRKQTKNIEYYNKVILRFGSYLGEVIIKESKNAYEWMVYEESVEINSELSKYGKNILTIFTLHHNKKTILFPMVKIDKYLRHGKQDSLHFYAKVIENR